MLLQPPLIITILITLTLNCLHHISHQAPSINTLKYDDELDLPNVVDKDEDDDETVAAGAGSGKKGAKSTASTSTSKSEKDAQLLREILHTDKTRDGDEEGDDDAVSVFDDSETDEDEDEEDGDDDANNVKRYAFLGYKSPTVQEVDDFDPNAPIPDVDFVPPAKKVKEEKSKNRARDMVERLRMLMFKSEEDGSGDSSDTSRSKNGTNDSDGTCV